MAFCNRCLEKTSTRVHGQRQNTCMEREGVGSMQTVLHELPDERISPFPA